MATLMAHNWPVMGKRKKPSKPPSDDLLNRQYLDPSDGPRVAIKLYITKKDKDIIIREAKRQSLKTSAYIARIIKRHIEDEKRKASTS